MLGKINVDINSPSHFFEKYWQFGVGSCHISLFHRADLQKQLKYVHDELGFKMVRGHGVFCRDMNVIQSLSEKMPVPGASNVYDVNFMQVGIVYDAILAAGMKPFVEISFMPEKLAKGRKKSPFGYQANVTPPKDHLAWQDFIRKFTEYLVHRYGEAEVSSWYFEVWNEPNVPFFWTGKQRDYFNLYASTAKAIKSVLSDARVGGPSTAHSDWIPEFRDFCKQNDVPCDFISTHQYPADAIGHAVSKKLIIDMVFKCLRNMKKLKGKSLLYGMRMIFPEPDEKLALNKRGGVTESAKRARVSAGDLPLYYTEWNCSSTCYSPIHDTRQSAAFAVKSVLDNQPYVTGSMFFNFSDIFEEMYILPDPFSGTFGLLTVHGIPKPSFWAFKLLSQLADSRIDLPVTNDPIEYAVFKDDRKLQILLYRQSFVQEKPDPQPIDIQISGMGQIAEVKIQIIDDNHCNPLKVWQEMGSPKDLLPSEVEQIKQKSKLAKQDLIYSFSGDHLSTKTALAVNDIQLITISFEK